MRLAIAAAFAGLIWGVFQALEDTGWTYPLARGGVLGCVAVLSVLLVVRPAQVLVDGRAPGDGVVRAWCLAVGAVAAAIVAGLIWAEGARSSRVLAVGLLAASAGLAGLGALGGAGRAVCEWVGRHSGLVLAAVGVVAVGVRLVAFGRHLPYPDLNDIGQTTLDAIAAVMQGRNPYAEAIDFNTPDPAFPGYKYPPAMMAIYFPLGATLGVVGVRVTNLVLDLVTAGLVVALARRHGLEKVGVAGAGVVAASLYLLMPIVAADIFQRGVTDLAAVVPMLVALLLAPRHAGWAGVAAGLAVSMKLFPGVLAVLCCVPAQGRGRYAAGVAVGLLPMAAGLAWDPVAFVRSIFLFNLYRPPNASSIAAALPGVGGWVLKLGSAAVLAGVAALVWWRRPGTLEQGTLERCAAVVVATVAVLAAGPVVHNNYMIWWLPAFAVVAAGPLAVLVGVRREG
jgi:hypothetical protein